jgi:transposase
MSEYHVGIDLHKSVIQVCVLGGGGDLLEEKRHQVEDRRAGEAVIEDLLRFRDQGRFVVEAVGMNRWFVNGCREAGLDMVVADPTRLKLKESGKKTDRRDARELARRLYLGDIDRHAKTYFPTDLEHGVTKVLRVRHRLVSIRQRLVNQIRGMLNAYLIRPPQSSLYSKKSLAWLEEQELPVEDLTAALQSLVSALAGIQEQVDALTARIRVREKTDREVALLVESLPSVAAQTAATLRYELGDVSRFRNTRAVACYAGLVPRVANSADKSHHGAVTKRGKGELRWILSEWAVRLMSQHPGVKAWAAPRLRRMHKNKVRITLARRLLVGVYVMLSRGEAFSLERCLAA